jgi:deoxyribodipyrimidine photo-lyase
MGKKPVILWFRRDLRLADNPAVDAAARAERPVIPVFVLDERPGRCWDNGGASRWWLHGSLAALGGSLGKLGGRLILRRGDPAREIEAHIEESGAGHLFFQTSTGTASKRLELEVEQRLAGRVAVQAFAGHSLYPPGSVRTAAGEPYRVFTPFWRACRGLPDPAEPLAAPEKMLFHERKSGSHDLADWALTPSSPDWAGGLRESWTPGEQGALARAHRFIDVIRNYGDDHDRPDREGTSRLSPHLHFGEISPRQLWHQVHRFCDVRAKGPEAFLRQLYWREFSHHLLHAFPDLPRTPLREACADFPWGQSDAHLDAWQRGMTGYPIVDAGMRELWRTGWMHNRLRMVAASLLVKHLLIPWQDGAAWFHDTLVDADEANNSVNWQWVAGCGTDAAPYFRIFNPVTQGRKFDPDGRHTRRWVPELAKLETRWLHAPWEAPGEALRRAGIRLGDDYPLPVIEHRAGRERALAAFRSFRSARA